MFRTLRFVRYRCFWFFLKNAPFIVFHRAPGPDSARVEFRRSHTSSRSRHGPARKSITPENPVDKRNYNYRPAARRSLRRNAVVRKPNNVSRGTRELARRQSAKLVLYSARRGARRKSNMTVNCVGISRLRIIIIMTRCSERDGAVGEPFVAFRLALSSPGVSINVQIEMTLINDS